MAIHDEFRAAIKKSYGFDDWTRLLAGQPRQSVTGMSVATAIPGTYQLQSHWRSTDQKTTIDHYQAKSDPAVKLVVTATEFPRYEDAHEAMVSLLGDHMAPDLPRLEKKGVVAGDVGFAGHDDIPARIFFVRHNILVKIENIGRKRGSAQELAESLDKHIVANAAPAI